MNIFNKIKQPKEINSNRRNKNHLQMMINIKLKKRSKK